MVRTRLWRLSVQLACTVMVKVKPRVVERAPMAAQAKLSCISHLSMTSSPAKVCILFDLFLYRLVES